MKRYSKCSTVFASLAICAAVTSCGSDDAVDTTQPATAQTASVPTTAETASVPTTADAASGDACADREALRSSVAALVDVDVVAEGTNGLTAAVDAVKSDLESVRASAGSAVGPQVQAVQDAIAAIEAGIGNLGEGGAVEVTAALSALSTATTTLLSSLEGGPCG